MRLLPLAAILVLAGCASAPTARSNADEIRALEQRLAELERKVDAAPAAAPAPAGHGQHAPDPRQLPQAALDLLATGNTAFAAGRPRPADLSPQRVHGLAAGQKPYAVIVACADSRVAPEHLFGAGLGDLFVVRVAGNVIDEPALASVEYAVAHLDCRLVVVMAHTACGAVKAAAADAKDTPAVAGLVARIQPAVTEARRDGEAGLADRAARINATRQRDGLRRDSLLLAGMEKAGEVRLATACYDLDDGAVDWLDLDGLTAAAKPAAPAAPAAPAKPAPPAHH